MPIAIAGVDDPKAVVSPLVELGSALHVLRDPGHHDAGSWAVGVRRGMGPRLRGMTDAWAWTTQAIRATPFVTAFPGSFDEAVAALREVEPRRLARQLLRPIAPSGDTGPAVRWGRSRGRQTGVLVETLVEEPRRAVAEFTEFLELSRDEWFGAEWDRVRPGLAARARRFADTVRSRGAVAALTGIDPSVRPASRPDGITIEKVQNARHDVSARGLLVAPSAFVSPHLYVANVPGRAVLLIHPLEVSGPVPAAAELSRRLVAVSSPARLEVARAIATEPRTAGEIAALWGLEPTLVTRQLRLLAAVGLARTTRRERFVQYELDIESVRALGNDLAGLLLR